MGGGQGKDTERTRGAFKGWRRKKPPLALHSLPAVKSNSLIHSEVFSLFERVTITETSTAWWGVSGLFVRQCFQESTATFWPIIVRTMTVQALAETHTEC